MELVTQGKIVKLNSYEKDFGNGIATIREVALTREGDGKLIKFRVDENSYKVAVGIGEGGFVAVSSSLEPNKVTDLAQIRNSLEEISN